MDVTELMSLVWTCAGAATAPLLQENPDYVFPSEKVNAAVTSLWMEHGLPHPDQIVGTLGPPEGPDDSHNVLKRTEPERAERDRKYGTPWRVKVAKGLGVNAVPMAEVKKGGRT
jgi:hypothetical protein